MDYMLKCSILDIMSQVKYIIKINFTCFLWLCVAARRFKVIGVPHIMFLLDINALK